MKYFHALPARYPALVWSANNAINIFSLCEVASAENTSMTATFRHLRSSVLKESLYRLK